MAVIRVLIADDHTLVRTGLARLLEEQPELDVVGEAINGQDAVEQAQELRPDVVLMDVSMPRMNGIEATRQIARQLPDVKVIGLSMHETDAMAPMMLEAGAVAYIAKTAPPDDLIAAIRAAS